MDFDQAMPLQGVLVVSAMALALLVPEAPAGPWRTLVGGPLEQQHLC